MSEHARGNARAACCWPDRWRCRWRSAAAASRPTNAKATARRRAARSGSSGCGGAPTAASAAGHLAAGAAHYAGRRLVRGPRRSSLQSAHQGAAAIQGRPAGAPRQSVRLHRRARPQYAARGSPGAAAQCSSMWRGRILRRPPAASRSTSSRCADCSRASARGPESWLSNYDQRSRRRNLMSLAENRRADAHMGGAERSRRRNPRSCPSTAASVRCARRSWR